MNLILKNKELILQNFIAGEYEQIFCEKCATTFLTNVYEYDERHVLLEKRSLGLEYYCGAIHQKDLVKVPDIHRIGVLDESDNIVAIPSEEIIYSGEETDFRFIYIMEKLQHLDEQDSAYFDRCIKDMEWKKAEDRKKVIANVSTRYDPALAEDIMKLYEFYKKYENVLAWDLHGDNLMQRIDTNEIVIIDPYTRSA